MIREINSVLVLVISMIAFGNAALVNPEDKTCKVMENLLNAHNQCRKNVDPPANPALPTIRWDFDLARKAEEILDNGPCGKPTTGRISRPYPYGENLGGHHGDASEYDSDEKLKQIATETVEGWCNSGNGATTTYSLTENSCSFSSYHLCTPYLHMVADTATRVGCSFKTCDRVNGTGDYIDRGHSLVCLYQVRWYWFCKPYNREMGVDDCTEPCKEYETTTNYSSSMYIKTHHYCQSHLNDSNWCEKRVQSYYKVETNKNDTFLGGQSDYRFCS